MQVTLQNRSTPHTLKMFEKFRWIAIIKLFKGIFMKYHKRKFDIIGSKYLFLVLNAI